MQFTLTIKLGNEAMQTGENLADALSRIGGVLEGTSLMTAGEAGNVRDLNGNTVGRWEIVR